MGPLTRTGRGDARFREGLKAYDLEHSKEKPYCQEQLKRREISAEEYAGRMALRDGD
jgi:hypothetical protein